MSRLTINSNIASLNAQRNFSTATKKLSDSYTRLSSGLRINRAVDDAAGLSISESLKADTRLFNQGVRNLNDGLSLLNVADGALNELSNIVTRLSELAEQSANGTLGNKQRLSIDQEAQSLSKEYNRIARSTEFNGRKIFNGDFGDLSLAAGGGRESLIVEDLGGRIGDGSFQSFVSISTNGFSAQTLTSADYNNDGYEDIATSDNSALVQIYLNNGNGTFKSGLSFNPTTGANWRIQSADMNNDGVLDIIVGNLVSDFSVMLGNGDGSFKTGVSNGSGGGYNGQPNQLAILDLNSDGVMDIVTSNSFQDRVHLFYGKGNGSFIPVSSYNNPGFGTVGTIAAGDFNNDGKVDLSISYSGGVLETRLNMGDGTFRQASTSVIEPSSGQATINVLDLDNDGNLDFTSITGSGSYEVQFGNGDGTFKNRQLSLISANLLTASNSGDFNGDGNVDLLFRDSAYVSGGNYSSYVVLSNGNGTFKSAVSYSSPNGYSDGWGLSFEMASKDFNNDGVLDILISSQSNQTLSIHFGNGSSGVSALQSFSLRTQQDSKDSITYLRQTLNRLSHQRGEVGAFQSRVETGVSNLQQSSLAYSEAGSRITDVDVAEESSRLTANQILQQAAASVLTQANLQPQLVLRLLNGI
jgi:flagellin